MSEGNSRTKKSERGEIPFKFVRMEVFLLET